MGPDRVGPGVGAHLRIGVETSLVPGVLQTLALLQVAHTELEAAVDSALAQNPMLERAPGHPCPGCGRHVVTQRCGVCGPAGRPVADAEVSPLDTLRVLAACEIRSGLRQVLDVVLDHLTDRGILDTDEAKIAAAYGFELMDVQEAVRAIKAVGPVGIAERTVPDLLGAQAQELVGNGLAPQWIVPLVRRHLVLIGDDDTGAAAELFGVDRAVATEVFSIVRRELRPVAVFDGDQAQAPARTPDIYIRRDKQGALRVETPDSRWFGLVVADISPSVAANDQARLWLHRYERDARNLLSQLNVRADVLGQVAAAAACRQTDFFEQGATAHRDLTRSEIAHELGLHPSTVARAVRDKVVRTPNGEFMAFKQLFGTGVAARAELAIMLRQSASSDAQLASALAARGYPVARRTVAKYRAGLNIHRS